MNNKTDIIVVGCGIVGCVAALLLADNNFSVRVIDAKQLSADAGLQKSAWVSSLNLTSEKTLQAIGVSFSDLGDFATQITALDVKDVNAGSLKFLASTIAKSHLATIVDNAALLQALWQKLKTHSNIVLCVGESIVSVDNSETVIVNTSASAYSADLLLAADGAKSKVRSLVGIDFKARSYEHTALVATISTQLPHNNIGRQWFHPSGPLAFLPIDNNNLQAIVWSHKDAANYLDSDLDKLAQTLTEHSMSELGAVSSPANLLAFPLYERRVKNYFNQRVCLLGDAAHTIHPLAGQGANLGIADAACIARVLSAATAGAKDFCTPYTLLKYQRERSAENSLMLQLMQFLQHSTVSSGRAACSVRKAALHIIDESIVLKKLFMQAAS